MPLTEEDFEDLDERRAELLGEDLPDEDDDDGDDDSGVRETMSPFDGDDYPEELRGKSPQEVASLFQQVKTAGKEMAELAMRNMQQPRQAPVPQPEPEPPPKLSPEDFLSDESDIAAKIGAIAEHKIAPLRQELINNQARATYVQAFEAAPYLKDYQQEINQILTSRQLSPEAVADPRTWAAIRAHILETHGKEIYEKQYAQKKKPPPPDVERGDTRQRVSNKGNVSKLSKEQLQFAKVLGVDPKDAEKFADWVLED